MGSCAFKPSPKACLEVTASPEDASQNASTSQVDSRMFASALPVLVDSSPEDASPEDASPEDASPKSSTSWVDSHIFASAVPVLAPGNFENGTIDPMLEQFVEASFGAAYAIEWVLSASGKLECKSWYNPEWRIKEAQQNGWSGLFTIESAKYSFTPGEGIVGKAFASKKMHFVSDIQAEADNKRMELEKIYNIHSVLFIPHGPNGLVEVGTTLTLAFAGDFLPQAAINTIMAPPTQLQQLVEASYGALYGIEWALSDKGKLKCKSWYNPGWRMKAAETTGQHCLFTTRSASFSFRPGEGLVGKIFAKQETTFVANFQSASECKRIELAKEFGICSVLFIPRPFGLLEIGTNRAVSVADRLLPPLALKAADENRYSTPSSAKLRELVEASFGGAYAIEWTYSVGTGELVCSDWYTPEWRKDFVKQQGLSSLFTVESASHTFAPGEGVVGEVFSTQEIKFVPDVQSESSNKRAALDKKYGIHSVLFIPSACGLLEVGTTETFQSCHDFFPNERVSSILSAPTQLQQLVEASDGGVYGLEWVLTEAGILRCKSWYNPEWRIKVAQQNGWAGLFTIESTNYSFRPGEGIVGKVFARNQTRFIPDMQVEPDNKRREIEKKFEIHSVVFIPHGNGLLEIGTTRTVHYKAHFLPETIVNRILSPPSQLQRLVDASFGGVYGLEWVMTDSGRLECKSWYNSYPRMKLAQQSGLKRLFTCQSATWKFMPGEGAVGETFKNKKTKFVSDVQTDPCNKRKEWAKQFGIRSVVFIPVGTSCLMEIGTNQTFNSLAAFLPEKAIEIALQSDGQSALLYDVPDVPPAAIYL